MGMSSTTRTGIVAAAAAGTLAIAALAGTAVANAAGSTNPSPSATTQQGHSDGRFGGSAAGQQRPAEEALTGDTAAKVKAAVEAKYPGATIDRMEKDADGQSAYEAHITKADGTHVTVLLDADYAITGEWAGGPGGKGGLAGEQRPAEEALTGDTAAKVKAAVEAKYPGATIDRMEKDADGQSVYEAHITKADGTHVTVLLDADYAITGESAGGPGHRGGRGGHDGHRPSGDPQGTAASPSGSAA